MFEVSKELQEKGFQAGFLTFHGIQVQSQSLELDEVIRKLVEETKEAFREEKLSEFPPVEKVRRLFSRCGIDPTKHRPSPEALARRVLRGDPFPKINTVVDIGNYIQLKYLTPLGLYDWEAVKPPITLRIGKANESYVAIGNRLMNAYDRIIAVDSEGIFGSPIADSERAKITLSTSQVLVIFYVPSDFVLSGPMQEMIQKISRFTGGEVIEEIVIQ